MDILSYQLGKKAGGGGTPATLIDKNISANGTYNASSDEADGYKKVVVDVEPNLQNKNVTISTNTTTTIEKDNGYDGLGTVSVTTNIPIPKQEAEEKDVNFYDFTGFRHYSYTKNEFLQLSEMPTLPEMEGMTPIGWNWSFQDATDYVTEYGILDVGTVYTTSDGSVRVHINLYDEYRLSPTLGIGVRGTAYVDWGDNSELTELTGTNYTVQQFAQHTYPSTGNYIIKISWPQENDGQLYIQGTNNNYGTYALISDYGEADDYYYSTVTRVDIPTVRNNWIFGNKTFYDFTELKSISLGQNTGNSQLANCDYFAYQSNLKCFITPQGWTDSYASFMFSKVERYIFHKSFTAENGINFSEVKHFVVPYSFRLQNGYRLLTEMIIPKELVVLNYSMSFLSIKVLDFSHHTTIPAFGTNGKIGFTPADAKIIVPDALYNDWIVANKWSNHASKIIRKSDWDALNN